MVECNIRSLAERSRFALSSETGLCRLMGIGYTLQFTNVSDNTMPKVYISMLLDQEMFLCARYSNFILVKLELFWSGPKGGRHEFGFCGNALFQPVAPLCHPMQGKSGRRNQLRRIQPVWSEVFRRRCFLCLNWNRMGGKLSVLVTHVGTDVSWRFSLLCQDFHNGNRRAVAMAQNLE